MPYICLKFTINHLQKLYHKKFVNFERYISNRILRYKKNQRSVSRPIVRIAVAGIALGICVMILTMAIITGFQGEIKNKVIGFGAHITVTRYNSNTSNEPQPFTPDREFIQKLQNHPEVRKIQSYAIKNGIIKTKEENEGVVLKGVDNTFDWNFFRQNLIEGKVPDFSDSLVSNETLISKSISARLKIKTGEEFLIYFISQKPDNDSSEFSGFEHRVRKLKVCGIYETGFEDFDNKIILGDIRQIRKLNYWQPDQIGGIEILVKDYKKLEATGLEIYDLTPQGLSSQTIIENNPTIFSWLNLMDSNAVIIIVLMILVAAINMISAILIMIIERTNTIGLLKAMGANNTSVKKIFINKSVQLLWRGLLAGNLIAVFLCILQWKFKFITLEQETYYMAYVPVQLNWQHIVLLNAGTMAACLLIMLLPVMIISRINPVNAIRFS